MAFLYGWFYFLMHFDERGCSWSRLPKIMQGFSVILDVRSLKIVTKSLSYDKYVEMTFFQPLPVYGFIDKHDHRAYNANRLSLLRNFSFTSIRVVALVAGYYLKKGN